MSRDSDLVVPRAKKSPLQNALQRAHVNRSRQRTGALLERRRPIAGFERQARLCLG